MTDYTDALLNGALVDVIAPMTHVLSAVTECLDEEGRGRALVKLRERASTYPADSTQAHVVNEAIAAIEASGPGDTLFTTSTEGSDG